MLKCIFCIKQLFGTRTLLFSEQRPLQRVWLLYSVGRSSHVCSAWAECLMSSRVGWYNYVGPRVWTLQYSTVNYSIIQYSTVLQVDKSDKIALLVGKKIIKKSRIRDTLSLWTCADHFSHVLNYLSHVLYHLSYVLYHLSHVFYHLEQLRFLRCIY